MELPSSITTDSSLGVNIPFCVRTWLLMAYWFSSSASKFSMSASFCRHPAMRSKCCLSSMLVSCDAICSMFSLDRMHSSLRDSAVLKVCATTSVSSRSKISAIWRRSRSPKATLAMPGQSTYPQNTGTTLPSPCAEQTGASMSSCAASSWMTRALWCSRHSLCWASKPLVGPCSGSGRACSTGPPPCATCSTCSTLTSLRFPQVE
mmetsp:Transcript_27599/g.71111  ORF Transcript_27599/g.71111 Transcript_27599/m.71111 type:complete len:205 (-) Transcript_27599:330-944(-)